MSNENAGQIEYWSGSVGQRWTRYQEAMDRVVRPHGDAAIATAYLLPGERILDVGCGCGDTSLALSRLVGAEGHVLGVDISPPMLERAKERLSERGAGSAPIDFLEADAASAPLPTNHDLVFSRFGVMFFADPTAAFSHLRTRLRGSGRLAFVCWRAPEQNPWATLPVAAVAPHLVAEPPGDPLAPGPFAFADPARVESILESAGYGEISLVPVERRLQWTRTADLPAALDLLVNIGPTSRRLAEASPEVRARAIDALSAFLQQQLTPEGLFFDSATWLVTASAR